MDTWLPDLDFLPGIGTVALYVLYVALHYFLISLFCRDPEFLQGPCGGSRYLGEDC